MALKYNSMPPRFFFANVNGGKFENGATINLSGEDARHLRLSLRMREGEEILVCDGAGVDYLCVLERVGEGEALARVKDSNASLGEPGCKVALYQSLPKSDKFDYVVQKCVEAGVHSITPVLSERVEFTSRARGAGGDKHIGRWRRIAYETAKQAGRGIIPQVYGYIDFSRSVDRSVVNNILCDNAAAACSPPRNYLALIPYEGETKRTLKSELTAYKAKTRDAGTPERFEIVVFIGPEGGFAINEIDYAVSRGIVPVTLGRRIFRTETAGLAVICQIMYEFEQ